MTISAGTVIIGTKIDFSKLQSQLKKVTRAVTNAAKKMSRAFLNVAAGLAKALLAITALLGVGLLFGIKEAIDYETALNKMNKTLIATGHAAGLTRRQLIANAAEIQKISTTSEAAALGMQALLLTFKNIAGPTFKRTTKAIIDMSEGMGQDLKSSTIQLGKALNDPITQLSALARIGIKFDPIQIKMIKNFAETNQLAKAQAIILTEIESQFGGVGTQMETTGQALKQLFNQFTDFLRAFGAPLLTPIRKASDAMKKFFEDNTKRLTEFTQKLSTAFQITFEEKGLGAALNKIVTFLFDVIKIKTKEWFNSLKDLLLPLFNELGFIIGREINASLPTFLQRDSKETLQAKLTEVKSKKKLSIQEQKDFIKQFPSFALKPTKNLPRSFTNQREQRRDDAIAFLEKRLATAIKRDDRVTFEDQLTGAFKVIEERSKKAKEEIEKLFEALFKGTATAKAKIHAKQLTADLFDAFLAAPSKSKSIISTSLNSINAARGSAMQSESRRLFTGARGGQMVAATASELFGIGKTTITQGDKEIIKELRKIEQAMIMQPITLDKLKNVDVNHRVLEKDSAPFIPVKF